MSSTDPPATLTVAEAAAVLGVHRTRIYQLIDDGRLTRGHRHGIDVDVTVHSVIDYRDNRRGPGRPRKDAP